MDVCIDLPGVTLPQTVFQIEIPDVLPVTINITPNATIATPICFLSNSERNKRLTYSLTYRPLLFKMLSHIFILNLKGEVLVSRTYRNDSRQSYTALSDWFRINIVSNKSVRSPISTTSDASTFYHVKHENLYIVAVSSLNANVALIFELLNRIISLGVSYFIKFTEDAVEANFTLIYELLDEICDFGYPQTTDADTLKLYITTSTLKSERATVIMVYIGCRRVKDCDPGDRRSILASSGYQVSQERMLCRHY